MRQRRGLHPFILLNLYTFIPLYFRLLPLFAIPPVCGKFAG